MAAREKAADRDAYSSKLGLQGIVPVKNGNDAFLSPNPDANQSASGKKNAHKLISESMPKIEWERSDMNWSGGVHDDLMAIFDKQGLSGLQSAISAMLTYPKEPWNAHTVIDTLFAIEKMDEEFSGKASLLGNPKYSDMLESLMRKCRGPLGSIAANLDIKGFEIALDFISGIKGNDLRIQMAGTIDKISSFAPNDAGGVITAITASYPQSQAYQILVALGNEGERRSEFNKVDLAFIAGELAGQDCKDALASLKGKDYSYGFLAELLMDVGKENALRSVSFLKNYVNSAWNDDWNLCRGMAKIASLAPEAYHNFLSHAENTLEAFGRGAALKLVDLYSNIALSENDDARKLMLVFSSLIDGLSSGNGRMVPKESIGAISNSLELLTMEGLVDVVDKGMGLGWSAQGIAYLASGLKWLGSSEDEAIANANALLENEDARAFLTRHGGRSEFAAATWLAVGDGLAEEYGSTLGLFDGRKDIQARLSFHLAEIAKHGGEALEECCKIVQIYSSEPMVALGIAVAASESMQGMGKINVEDARAMAIEAASVELDLNEKKKGNEDHERTAISWNRIFMERYEDAQDAKDRFFTPEYGKLIWEYDDGKYFGNPQKTAMKLVAGSLGGPLGEEFPKIERLYFEVPKYDHISGLTYEGTNVILLSPKEKESVLEIITHELLHQVTDLSRYPDFTQITGSGINIPKFLDEGLTDYFAKQLVASNGFDINFDVGYEQNVKVAFFLKQILGERSLKDEYFSGYFDEVERRLDAKLGDGSFKEFLGKKGAAEMLEFLLGKAEERKLELREFDMGTFWR